MAGGGGEQELLFNGDRVSVLKKKQFCGWMVVIVAKQHGCT